MTQTLRQGLEQWQDRRSSDAACHTERRDFLRFCATLDLPPTPDAVALYLVHLHQVRPRSAAALRYRLRLLDLAAALAGEPIPGRDASLRLFLRGLHRTLSDGEDHSRTPLYLEDVDALLQAIGRDRSHQRRDTAFVLLADAVPLPVQVLRQLQWHQVRLRKHTLLLELPNYRWARGPRGRVEVHPRSAPLCPVEAMRVWSRTAGPANGYVFSTRNDRPPSMQRAAALLAPLPTRESRWDGEPAPAPASLLASYLAELNRPRPRELRDRAAILLAFAACLTPEEFTQLRVSDVHTAPRGLIVDPSGRSYPVGVPRGRVPARCPVVAWNDWSQHLVAHRRDDPDQLAFPTIRGTHIGRTGLDGNGPSHLVVSRCDQAGLVGHYGFLSLRIGFMRTAARAGVPEQVIAQQAGLRYLDSVSLHVRREQLLSHNVAGLVGL